MGKLGNGQWAICSTNVSFGWISHRKGIFHELTSCIVNVYVNIHLFTCVCVIAHDGVLHSVFIVSPCNPDVKTSKDLGSSTTADSVLQISPPLGGHYPRK